MTHSYHFGRHLAKTAATPRRVKQLRRAMAAIATPGGVESGAYDAHGTGNLRGILHSGSVEPGPIAIHGPGTYFSRGTPNTDYFHEGGVLIPHGNMEDLGAKTFPYPGTDYANVVAPNGVPIKGRTTTEATKPSALAEKLDAMRSRLGLEQIDRTPETTRQHAYTVAHKDHRGEVLPLLRKGDGVRHIDTDVLNLARGALGGSHAEESVHDPNITALLRQEDLLSGEYKVKPSVLGEVPTMSVEEATRLAHRQPLDAKGVSQALDVDRMFTAEGHAPGSSKERDRIFNKTVGYMSDEPLPLNPRKKPALFGRFAPLAHQLTLAAPGSIFSLGKNYLQDLGHRETMKAYGATPTATHLWQSPLGVVGGGVAGHLLGRLVDKRLGQNTTAGGSFGAILGSLTGGEAYGAYAQQKRKEELDNAFKQHLENVRSGKAEYADLTNRHYTPGSGHMQVQSDVLNQLAGRDTAPRDADREKVLEHLRTDPLKPMDASQLSWFGRARQDPSLLSGVKTGGAFADAVRDADPEYAKKIGPVLRGIYAFGNAQQKACNYGLLGGAVGAGIGALRPVREGESRERNMVQGAAIGGVAGGIGGGIHGAHQTLRNISNEEAVGHIMVPAEQALRAAAAQAQNPAFQEFFKKYM